MMSEAWYKNPFTDDGHIISSRVRLARNVRKYPFRAKLGERQAREMVDETISVLSDQFTSMEPSGYSNQDIRMLLEKHIISREFVNSDLPKGLLLKDDFNVSIMVNEEDHIRIQAISAGENLQASWEEANRVDDFIEKSLEFAFNQEYGYLTACPTNVGTGMRASFMIHLPMLERMGQIKDLLPTIGKFGIAIRGIYGEGSESMGGIFQISNQVTLGHSEDEIIKSLQSIAKNIIDKENLIRERVYARRGIEIENNIFRSYGILTHFRKAGLNEAMDMLSDIRLGYAMGILDFPKPDKNIYQIMMEIQPGHLLKASGEELDEAALDIARAEYLRKIF